MPHLRHLLRGVWFRRLLGVRLSSQLSDGVFQVALASYALFSEDQPSPRAVAAALAVVLLPFSVLGPFVGVFLDRWSRRQVLVWANYLRVAMVAGVAGLVALEVPDPWFYLAVLACLSVNRFLLAGLSAALPHTVSGDDLVTANALTPTAGTLAFVLGLGVGGLVRTVADSLPGPERDVWVLLTASALYAVAGSLALRIPRHQLGPDLAEVSAAVRTALAGVISGLRAGLSHLAQRRTPATALGTIGAHRYLFGIASVSWVLLYRNYFHSPRESDDAFADLAVATMVAGAGFLVAALLTPGVTEHIGHRAWVVGLLLAGAFVQLFPGLLFTKTALLVSAFVLGLVSQGIKIVVDTEVQLGVDDAFRGRVFSLYDVLFNVMFVAAAATAAVVLPDNGRSPVVLATLAAGYVATAIVYGRLTGVSRR